MEVTYGWQSTSQLAFMRYQLLALKDEVGKEVWVLMRSKHKWREKNI